MHVRYSTWNVADCARVSAVSSDHCATWALLTGIISQNGQPSSYANARLIVSKEHLNGPPRLTCTQPDALRVNSETYFRNSVFSRRRTDIAAPMTLIAVWNRLHMPVS